MPVIYKSIKTVKPGEKAGSLVFEAPKVMINATIDPEMFLKKLSQHSRIDHLILYGCFVHFRDFLLKEISNGNIVQTGIFGTFSPVVKNSKKKANNGQLEITIGFRPTGMMKINKDEVGLEKVRKK